ncbi:lipopolysaccharide kinase InaA family protein [Coraliomargarita sp. W4R53]
MPSGSTIKRKVSTKKPSSHKPRFVNLTRPSKLDLEFCIEAGKGLRPFQYQSPNQESAAPRLCLGDGFFGFGLAVPSDAAECVQILDLVKDSGVHAVRFDFSYGQDYDLSLQLLSRLQALGVSVLLHIVPSLAAARRMPAAEALEEWQLFLSTSYDCFSEMIEAIEVGATINRAKWSGTDLAGFLQMWELAHVFCCEKGITLVGPNVTDFEPQYNAGALGMLQRRGLLPDIHSNNLFAERSVEPEVADHKIMGPALRNLHGYDLRKKVSLLAAIAGRYGLTRNWSTCAFWTVPRIQRYLALPEEQMADYLVRYYILCASVGNFERIYWGPLVSYREGLVDDGTEDRSSSDHRDVVTYYSAYPGEPAQWRRRPAFYALRALIQRLSGFHYHAALCAENGLEIHEFHKDDQICVVAWTRNGRLARIKDCFSAESQATVATLHSRDGAGIAAWPDFLTESPTYFLWKDGNQPEVLETAQRLPQLMAARAPQGMRYFDYATEDWRGVILAASRDEAELICQSLAPDVIGDFAETASLRKSRNAIWTVVDPRNSHGMLVVKKPRTIAWHKRILDRRKPSKALRSWNGTSELMRRGVETPKVVAYFESADPQRVLENWFFCEHVSGGHSVRSFFTKYAGGAGEVEGYTFKMFTVELLLFIRDMHWRGVLFRDLAGGNVLVSIQRDGRLQFSLIDTARARFKTKRFSLKQRVADLKRLVHKLAPDQQTYFMEAYLEKEGARFGWNHQLSFALYAIKTWLKRHKRNLRRKMRS